jgi:hypothetical protein
MKVEADFKIYLGNIGLNEAIYYIPVLQNERRHIELPMILVCGLNRYKGFKRLYNGMGSVFKKWSNLFGNNRNIFREYNTYIYKIIKADSSVKRLAYCVYTPYEDWMRDAVIDIRT